VSGQSVLGAIHAIGEEISALRYEVDRLRRLYGRCFFHASQLMAEDAFQMFVQAMDTERELSLRVEPAKPEGEKR
jgi:hypothetical protein